MMPQKVINKNVIYIYIYILFFTVNNSFDMQAALVSDPSSETQARNNLFRKQQQTIEDLRKEIEDLKKECCEANQTRDCSNKHWMEQNSRLQKKNKELETKLVKNFKSCQDKSNQQEEENDSLRMELQKLEKQLKKAESDSILNKTMLELQSTDHTRQQKLDELQRNYNELKEENGKLHKDLEDAQNQIASLQRITQDLENKNKVTGLFLGLAGITIFWTTKNIVFKKMLLPAFQLMLKKPA